VAERGRVPFCRGDKVSLRALERSDLGEAYLGWLNDPEVNRHLFVGRRPTSFDALLEYFERARRDPDTVLFAVVDNTDGRHVGNVKMEMYDTVSRVVDWGILIGEKERWGQGLATEALALSVRFAFEKWNAHKVTLGLVEGHGFALRGMQDEAAVTTDPAAIGAEPMAGEGDHGGPRRGRRFETADKPE